jgi:hypothetical protein
MTKMRQKFGWAIFSQTHLVTLPSVRFFLHNASVDEKRCQKNVSGETFSIGLGDHIAQIFAYWVICCKIRLCLVSFL